MSAPRIISGLNQVADRYDALLCDVWGVIHNGRESFVEACDALVRYGEAHGPVVLISNAPRPAEAVKPQLAQLGVPQAAWADFVTSGDATVVELKARAPGPAWAVGPVRDAPLFEGTGVVFAEGPEDAAFIACTGLFDDEIETPDDYRERFAVAVDRGLAMICANPDRVVHRGDVLIYCAGALADVYEELGGQVIMVGKPFAPVYGCALSALERQLGRTVDPSRVLCIGDGLPTDVRGANDQGLDCLFVAGGIHAEAVLGPDGAVDPDRLTGFLTDAGAEAAYALPKLVW